ncbi:hypothetical protein PTNB73_04735 [Pyrenophora teres f. teres]|uniref:Uncharacterized protein n=1 Tax=Pyrenophora teres f. teres TaxID=97479 RepID=A0A6S6W1H6_9PLEO|nr:hypothetical protein HRS9139_05703 [Pyrenophora teres f. teres]KAE8840344.1 hypothetical protein PTNB85_03743 [Pyrenophora teres f. teres]KAE8849516.1 hypothetical protein HRS9122_03532 [Pyrenophora teres f. teres]KAE8863843.1 hypothetical protein PTNB29_03807 [Pyrenophora teres f. teres]KAE8866641.1 hypothetical protein PTNB73_04735 [Pyrenophora teres f. teres]
MKFELLGTLFLSSYALAGHNCVEVPTCSSTGHHCISNRQNVCDYRTSTGFIRDVCRNNHIAATAKCHNSECTDCDVKNGYNCNACSVSCCWDN